MVVNQFDNIFKFLFIFLMSELFISIDISSVYTIKFVPIELIHKLYMSLIHND